MQNKIASPLSRKAVLVSVSISQWSARKLDKEITDETNRRHNATKDAGRYNKLLIAKEHIAELTSLTSKARSLHYSMTQPWADEGPRILPNALYSKFTTAFRELVREHALAADKFEAAYPQFVEQRRKDLNGAFKESDYPPPSEIRSKFRLELIVLPFPDAADFRSDLDDDTVADIKAEMTAMSERVVNDAMKHTAGQILKLVGHMAEKLKEFSANEAAKRRGKKTERCFFMDSLVENVRELAGLLPAFNLTDDPNLSRITQRVLDELCVEDAETLRDNGELRDTIAKSADEIVEEVGKFFA